MFKTFSFGVLPPIENVSLEYAPLVDGMVGGARLSARSTNDERMITASSETRRECRTSQRRRSVLRAVYQ